MTVGERKGGFETQLGQRGPGSRESRGKENKGTARVEGSRGHRQGPPQPLVAQSRLLLQPAALARTGRPLLPPGRPSSVPPPRRVPSAAEAAACTAAPGAALAWTRLEKGTGRPPRPFPPCDSAATARSVSSRHRSRWDLHSPVASSPLPLHYSFPAAPSVAGTWAGPTGPARWAGSGAAAMPAGPLPATCSPCAGARAPTAAP